MKKEKIDMTLENARVNFTQNFTLKKLLDTKTYKTCVNFLQDENIEFCCKYS